MNYENTTKLKFIDLFAGIGGLRLPFDEFGLKSVFSSEIDKFAQQTYQANFIDKPFGDITKISENNIPEHDLLLAGFPCQAFSVAGKKLGFEDTRGTMFFEIARILNYHKPKAFLLENVRGLLSHNKGSTFKTILNILYDLKYNVFYQLLNAKDFGLPQNRLRIYIVGFQDTSIDFKFPQPIITETKIGNILDSIVDNKYTISDNLWASLKKIKENHMKKGNGFGYSLFDINAPYVSTISARYYKDGSEILIKQQNKNPRKLTPREALRLQGFPEEFKIVCSDTQTYKQIGNSVAVPVIREIAKEIIKALNGKRKKESVRDFK